MSDRPYFREFNEAQGNPLVVPDDADAVIFAIGFPPNGRLIAFTVRQIDGTPIDAHLNLFRNMPAEDPADASRAMSRIVPEAELAVDPGVPLECKWDGYYYMNTEGTPAVPVRRIYLEIRPTHAVPATESVWEVSIGVVAGVFS